MTPARISLDHNSSSTSSSRIQEVMDLHKERLATDLQQLCYKSSEFPILSDSDAYEKMAQFLCSVGQLKSILRTGWILPGREVENCETISGHMYRMAIMAMMFEGKSSTGDASSPEEELDVNSMIRMCLLHDMAEAIVGDITPYDGISEDEKHQKESVAIEFMTSLLPEKISETMRTTYNNYESRTTPESKIVKQLDQFDIMVQAFQYERQEFQKSGRVIRFDEFFRRIDDNFHPLLVKIKQRIFAQRDKYYQETILPAQSAESNNNNNSTSQIDLL